MKPNARRFVLLTLGLAVGLTGGLALLNFIIDPYDRYNNNRLGVYISAERECKAAYIQQFPHDALLVGNSREVRIPPQQLSGFHFFNGAFSGATSEEVYYFLQHFATHERLVVVAVDIGTYDPVDCHGDIFAPKGLNSAFDNLFNLQTTEYSIRTLSEALAKHPHPIAPDGAVQVADWMQGEDRENPARNTFMVSSWQHAWAEYHCPPMAKMSFFVKISECLRQRGIPCVVVIPPTQAALAPARDGAVGAEVSAWKRQLLTIFPHVIDLSYSSYNASTNFYRSDQLHFRSETGVRFMNSEVLPFAEQILREISGSATTSQSPPGPGI